MHLLSLVKPTRERSPDAAKAEGSTGIEDRPLMCVTQPSCSAKVSGLHLWL